MIGSPYSSFFIVEYRSPVAPVAYCEIQPKRLKSLPHDEQTTSRISAEFVRQMLGYSVNRPRFKRVGQID
ncbi:MAG: hypothetical protein OEV58_10495, partial [Gammaproteobacteria bacterium]|nr:hypothetical protein [Gammaproteobacteria bacterium]